MNVCDFEFQGQPSRSHDFFQHIQYSHDLENVKIDTKINIRIMFTIRDKKGHAKRCLTLIFKVMQ